MMNEWNGTKVLVTGAGGFIGSHLVELLVGLGADVTALVNYNSRNSWGQLEKAGCREAANLEVVCGDIRDPYMMKNLVNGKDYVFHLAALIGIPYSYLAPNAYLATNAQGSANVFQACVDAGVKRVVHTSTSEVYGSARYSPMDEAHPLQGQSPYSASKIAADMTAQSYAYTYGLPIVTLRPFNNYGPRQSARAIIPTVISQALVGKPIEVGSLFPKRDFNYVGDTARGYLMLSRSRFRDGEVLNLATGQQISIGDLVERIQKLLGTDLQVITKDERKRPEHSEVVSLIGNSDLLRKETGWAPEMSFDDGLQRTIDHMRENIGAFKTDRYVV